MYSILAINIASIFALDKILLYLLNFAILFLGMTFLLYKPIKKFIKDRQDTIANQVKEAEDKEKEANEEKEKYSRLISSADTDIAKKYEEAEKEINTKTENALNDAYAKADEIKKKAEQEVNVEKEKAYNEFKEEIADIAVNMASDILGREITAKDNAKIIDDCLNEWSSKND